ncbi:putative receptor protein kinase ZmPK1 [Actinidia eriantha]|uniref:putative receptor protein kinase ZmPK1 n=1 Tax=Actinidia eriantha TaxID=165200 RepID=UPI0025855CC8|nr:putative receptor protein kinase ZmPK1 [Actinidia eriantha]
MDFSLSLIFFLFTTAYSSPPPNTLSGGSSLAVERHSPDVLYLPNGVFAAGFYAVGYNAFALTVWFAKLSSPSATVVWMANRDQPVNGKGSKLSLQKHSNLFLSYADRTTLWTTGTTSVASVELSLHNTDWKSFWTRISAAVVFIWNSCWLNIFLLHHAFRAASSKNEQSWMRNPATVPGLGANGAVNAIMLLDMFLFPKSTLYLEFFIPVPAILLGIFLIGKGVLRILEE